MASLGQTLATLKIPNSDRIYHVTFSPDSKKLVSLQSLERAEKIGTGAPERRFTERLARQHEIAKRLRTTPDETPNVSALAREFGVDRHTIRRDLDDIATRG